MTELDPATFDLPTLASLAGSSANRWLIERLRESGFDGVRASHGYVIQLLVDGQPTIGELAESLGVTQQAASKSIVELESMRLVIRRSDPSDSRVRRVALTDSGRSLLDSARRDRAALEREIADRVGDLDAVKDALVALLDATGGLAEVRRRRARPPVE